MHIDLVDYDPVIMLKIKSLYIDHHSIQLKLIKKTTQVFLKINFNKFK